MAILKKKIKTVSSLPPEKKKKIPISAIISPIIFLIILSIIGFFIYRELLPYINAININKITGKKINYSECNTKDYITIASDKSYSLSLTDESCNTKFYEGDLKIKYNEIIFKDNIKGTIDNSYNITINGKVFESDKDE